MSGGGDGTPGGEVIDIGPDLDCATLIDNTILSSPDPEVMSELKRGDILFLELQGHEGPLLAVTDSGKTAGSITSMKLLLFIQCMEEKFKYVAIVEKIDGGLCEISIRPAVKKPIGFGR